MSLFALLCGIERDQVRPDCHQNSHQSMSGELDKVELPSNTLGGGNAPFVVEPEPAHEKDYERLCATGEMFVYAAMIRLMVKRLALAWDFWTASLVLLWPVNQQHPQQHRAKAHSKENREVFC